MQEEAASCTRFTKGRPAVRKTTKQPEARPEAADQGGTGAPRASHPRELRHSFVSILSAHDVRLEDISDLVGHSSTSVTETVYRHEIRPALAKGATAMSRILKAKAAQSA